MTYEGFAEAWPSRDGEFADLFNSMPKYVVSSTLASAEWNNSTVLRGDLAEEVANSSSATTATSSCTGASGSCRR